MLVFYCILWQITRIGLKNMPKLKLKNGNIVTPGGVVKTDLGIIDGIILLETAGLDFDQVIDIEGKYVLPGFIDIHFHGYKGFNDSLGQYNADTRKFEASDEIFEAGFDMLSEKMAEFGTTGFYLATSAASPQALNMCCRALGRYIKKHETGFSHAKIFGNFLEGSFYNKDMAGAQNTNFIFDFTKEAFDSIDDGGVIKLANVAPEMDEKSIALTKYLTEKGIIVGAGHTNASCAQFEASMKAGLKYCVHFTNGPTGGSYKPFDGGGTIEAVLKHDDIYAELILDGCHVNPAYVRDIINRKGIDKIVGITDCGFIAGADIKEAHTGAVIAKVSEDGRYISVAGKKNVLAGSNLTMNRGFENLLNWLCSDMGGIWNAKHKAMPLEQALTATAKMCATNACKLTGLAEKGLGSITQGYVADLCLVDITRQNDGYSLNVEKTIVDGKIVYQK